MASTVTTEAFVDETLAAFEHACSRTEDSGHDFEFAGRHVRVRFAAPQLGARFRPALAHAVGPARSGATPDLEVVCWDTAVTGVSAPPPPWGLDAFLPTGRIRGHADGPVRASYDAVDRVLCLYDRDRRTAVLHATDHALVPTWMDRAPFRTILTWWAADRGLAMLHASAVADKGGSLALAGASGAGKSTTALTCLAHGLGVVGDDAVFVDLAGEPEVFAVYGLAKVEPDALDRLPALRASVRPLGDDSVVDLGDSLAGRAQLRAVAIPQVVNGDASRAVPVSTSDALRSVAASTMREGIAGGSLPVLGALVRKVPTVRLELGWNQHGVVEAVRRLLQP